MSKKKQKNYFAQQLQQQQQQIQYLSSQLNPQVYFQEEKIKSIYLQKANKKKKTKFEQNIQQQMPLIQRQGITTKLFSQKTDDSLLILNYPGIMPNEYSKEQISMDESSLQQLKIINYEGSQESDTNYNSREPRNSYPYQKKKEQEFSSITRYKEILAATAEESDEPQIPTFLDNTNSTQRHIYNMKQIENMKHVSSRLMQQSNFNKAQSNITSNDVRVAELSQPFHKNNNSQNYSDSKAQLESRTESHFLSNLQNMKQLYKQAGHEYSDQVQADFLKSNQRKTQLKNFETDIYNNNQQEKPPRPNITSNVQKGINSQTFKLKDQTPILAQSSKKQKVIKTEDSFYFPSGISSSEANRSFKDENSKQIAAAERYNNIKQKRLPSNEASQKLPSIQNVNQSKSRENGGGIGDNRISFNNLKNYKKEIMNIIIKENTNSINLQPSTKQNNVFIPEQIMVESKHPSTAVSNLRLSKNFDDGNQYQNLLKINENSHQNFPLRNNKSQLKKQFEEQKELSQKALKRETTISQKYPLNSQKKLEIDQKGAEFVQNHEKQSTKSTSISNNHNISSTSNNNNHRKLEKLKSNPNSQSTQDLQKINEQTLNDGDDSSKNKSKHYSTIEDNQKFPDYNNFTNNQRQQSQAIPQVEKNTPVKKRDTSNNPKELSSIQSQQVQNFYQTSYKNDLKQKRDRNQQLDVFLKVQNQQKNKMDFNRRERDMMRTFLKRHGYDGDDKIIFLLNSRDMHIKRAAIKRGWFENPIQNSSFFDVKWDFNDNQGEYNNMKPNQFYNHFPDGRELTTKQGLNKNINNITQHGIDIFQFYPRCYDFSDVRQIDLFQEDFNRTAILNIVKRHAKHFKNLFKQQLLTIYQEDCKINDNFYKNQAKRELKRKYYNKFPDDQEKLKLGTVNLILLQNALFYAKNVINDITEKCEGDEFIKKDFYVERYEFQDKIMELMLLYTNLSMPINEVPESHQILTKLTSWDYPSFYLMFVTYKLHKLLKINDYQYGAIDSYHNTWICKPSYNARGIGIFCFNSIKDLFNGSSKKSPAPKIVQKYIEKSLLLKNMNPQHPTDQRKFDLRQWVFVSSFDPLKIYIYKKAYLRLCGSSYDLEDVSDPFKHISNYSIQKNKQDTVVTDLVMSCEDFIEYLNKENIKINGEQASWDHFFKQISDIVKITLNSVAENIENRSNSFELYGFDFVIDKKLNCWLIEANMSPACAERTPWLTEMLDDMADGLISILEKKVVLCGQFNGQLGLLAEDYQNKKIKSQINQWSKIPMKPPSLDKKKKSNSSPTKQNNLKANINQVQQTTALNFNTNQKNYLFEIAGQKMSLKLERKIDKIFKQNCAANFIQKYWRGYSTRRQIFLQKMMVSLKESRRKKATKIFNEILEQIFNRVQLTQIIAQGFQEIKINYIAKKLGNNSNSMSKITKLQRYFKRKYQENKRILSRQKLDDTIGLDFLQVPNISYKIKSKGSNIHQELEELDQKRRELARFRGSMAPSKQSRSNFDQDLLLDFHSIGLQLNQVEFQTIQRRNESKTFKKLSIKNSPKQSPYLTNMRINTQIAFKKKPKQSTVKKLKDPIQSLNMTLIKTQRENKLNFDDEFVTEEILIQDEKLP